MMKQVTIKPGNLILCPQCPAGIFREVRHIKPERENIYCITLECGHKIIVHSKTEGEQQ